MAASYRARQRGSTAGLITLGGIRPAARSENASAAMRGDIGPALQRHTCGVLAGNHRLICE
jgi:hypothetical protein